MAGHRGRETGWAKDHAVSSGNLKSGCADSPEEETPYGYTKWCWHHTYLHGNLHARLSEPVTPPSLNTISGHLILPLSLSLLSSLEIKVH